MVKNIRVYIIGVALLLGMVVWTYYPMDKKVSTSESNLTCLKTDPKYQEKDCPPK